MAFHPTTKFLNKYGILRHICTSGRMTGLPDSTVANELGHQGVVAPPCALCFAKFCTPSD